MTRPSDRALSRWYGAQPEGEYGCADCGRRGSKADVQPQHPFFADGREGIARCDACIAVRIRAARRARKEQLASEPRCEADGCRRRGTWWLGAGRQVLMCGHHRRRAEATILGRVARAGMGHLALFGAVETTRSELLAAAETAD